MYPNLVESFENGSLNLKEFDHKMHLYIAWVYLNRLPKKLAIEKYCANLKALLAIHGYGKKFSYEITKSYFDKLDFAMKQDPISSFDDITAKIK